jgi:hypothetical protein
MSATYRERCRERARVIAIREYRAPSVEKTIQAFRQPYCEALHRARKRAMVVNLDEQMHMIRLHRKMHQSRA